MTVKDIGCKNLFTSTQLRNYYYAMTLCVLSGSDFLIV